MPAFSTTDRACSFCADVRTGGTLIAGGTGSLICSDCVKRYHEAIAAQGAPPETGSGAWRQMDKSQLLEQFLAILHQRAQVDAFIREWVALMKERSISWSEIGAALGVSRQAAWERFSKPRRA